MITGVDSTDNSSKAKAISNKADKGVAGRNMATTDCAGNVKRKTARVSVLFVEGSGTR